MVAKYLYGVAFFAVYTCYINHGNVHTDVAHIFCLLAIYQAIAMTIAKMTVQTISISYRNCSYHGVVLQSALTAIAHGICCRHVAYLQDGSL